MQPGERRPVIDDLPLSSLDVFARFVSVATLAAVFVVLVGTWNTLPERIPMHFNIAGAPDGWGTKHTIAILPIVLIAMNVLLFGIQSIPEIYKYPVKVTVENARRLYTVHRRLVIVVQALVNLLIGSLFVISIFVARHELPGLPWWLVPGFLVALISVAAWSWRVTSRAAA